MKCDGLSYCWESGCFIIGVGFMFGVQNDSMMMIELGRELLLGEREKLSYCWESGKFYVWCSK